jgi:hypothetical protein
MFEEMSEKESTRNISRVIRTLRIMNSLPPFTPVLERLLSLSPPANLQKGVVDQIALNQPLAAMIRRFVESQAAASSSEDNPPSPVPSPSPAIPLPQAVARIELPVLKGFALLEHASKVFKRPCPGFEAIRFCRHAAAVGFSAFRIGTKLGFPSPEHLFFAGVLHDIGFWLLSQHYAPELGALALAGAEGSAATLARESLQFGETHPEIGYNVCNQWRLPETVAVPILYHHTPFEKVGEELAAEVRDAVELLQIADSHARRSGRSFAEFDRSPRQFPLPGFRKKVFSLEEVSGMVGDLAGVLAGFETPSPQAPAKV